MLITGPLSRDAANLQIFPRPGGSSYDDFCEGDHMKRIYDTLPEGTAALTSVLFFDEINRDSKGFVTGDGVIIVGGFFNRSVMYVSYVHHTAVKMFNLCSLNVWLCNILKKKCHLYLSKMRKLGTLGNQRTRKLHLGQCLTFPLHP